MELAMGIYDSPQTQEQPIYYYNLFKSHMAVLGSSMSGKTEFVKTLLVRIHEDEKFAKKENIYIIDFNGSLESYKSLKRVCACFNSEDQEDIKRLFNSIEKRLNKNTDDLHGGNYTVCAKKNFQNCPSHTTLIIENINAFLADERYSAYLDKLIHFCRDGLSKGLTIVITGNETSGINRLLPNIGRKVALEMPESSYYDIFGVKTINPIHIPGRAVVNIESNVYECQIFMPFCDESENGILDFAKSNDIPETDDKMISFDDVLNRNGLTKFCEKSELDCLSQNNDVIVGLDYNEQKPVTVNAGKNRSIAIYGKASFGKSNLLKVILEGLYRNNANTRFIVFDDSESDENPLDHACHSKPETIYSADGMNQFLYKEGYCIEKSSVNEAKIDMEREAQNPFTVFIIRSKLFYARGSAKLRKNYLEARLKAKDNNCMFIFADVKTISDRDQRDEFFDTISVAFLLDDIAEFVAGRGSSNKSIFGDLELSEIKNKYAKCSVGDGYIYSVDTGLLKKCKFIRHS